MFYTKIKRGPNNLLLQKVFVTKTKIEREGGVWNSLRIIDKKKMAFKRVMSAAAKKIMQELSAHAICR